MSAASCPVCDDFHWLPRDHGAGWYQRDWRLLLDPAIAWMPCPRCRVDQPAGRRLRDAVTAMLLARLEEVPVRWGIQGSWRHGRDDEGQQLFEREGIYVLPPGPLVDPAAWTIISGMGVLRELDAARCRTHLARAGAPPLPDLDR